MRLRLNILILLILLILAGAAREACAFWVWTPETNKWVNPKYAVKETPQEQLEYALGYYNNDDCKAALPELQKLLKHYPRAREAPDAQFYIAKCQEKDKNLYAAFKDYQKVIEQYPFSNLTPQIIKIQYELGLKMLEGGENRGKFMSVLVGADYNAIDVFKTVIKNAPYSEYAAPSQYKIGLYLLEKQLYQEARDELSKVINDYPDSDWAKAAKYQIALTDAKRSSDAPYDQKVTQSAVDGFKDFVKNYPEAELSQNAKERISELREKEAENNFLVAQYYEKRKNFSSAKIYYQTIVEEYKNSKWAPKSLERIRAINQKIK